MRRGLRVRIAAFGTIILAGIFAQASSQEIPRNITKEELAKNNKLFIELAAKVLHWDEPTDPVKIVGHYISSERGA